MSTRHRERRHEGHNCELFRLAATRHRRPLGLAAASVLPLVWLVPRGRSMVLISFDSGAYRTGQRHRSSLMGIPHGDPRRHPGIAHHRRRNGRPNASRSPIPSRVAASASGGRSSPRPPWSILIVRRGAPGPGHLDLPVHPLVRLRRPLRRLPGRHSSTWRLRHVRSRPCSAAKSPAQWPPPQSSPSTC